MRIVGFVGPKGSGKDTSYEKLYDMKLVDGKISFAGPLKAVCGKVFDLHNNLLNDPVLKEKPLAEPITLTRRSIKEILNLMTQYVDPVTSDGIVLYNIDKVSVVGLEGREFKTPRELLQFIGTELIRDRVYKRWHLEAAFSAKVLNAVKEDSEGTKRRAYKPDGTYAVTDIRFENEHTFLQDKFNNAYKAFYVSRPEAEEVLSKATHASELETQKIRALLTDSVIDNSGSLDDLKKELKQLDLGTDNITTEQQKPGSRFKFSLKGE